MDPISLIVAALAAGAAAELKGMAGEVVKDSFTALKTLVRRRLRGDPTAEADLRQLARDPDADTSAFKQRLVTAGADADEQLLHQAIDLLARLDPQGARAGKYDVKVTGGKGVVVGDGASVTMNFND